MHVKGGMTERLRSLASKTMRMARSRTSGENLVDLLMAPFFQVREPPRTPVRFSPKGRGKPKPCHGAKIALATLVVDITHRQRAHLMSDADPVSSSIECWYQP